MAVGVHTIPAVVASRGLGPSAQGDKPGPGPRVLDYRRDHRSRPSRCDGRKKGDPQAIGKSRGGPSTKIHAVVDALGNPVRFTTTEGNRHDVTEAAELLKPCKDANVIADKAYDSQDLESQLLDRNCTVVIPSRSTNKVQRNVDGHLYKERFLVECFFEKIKRKRRIATRYEKLAKHYLAMVTIASILLWLI